MFGFSSARVLVAAVVLLPVHGFGQLKENDFTRRVGGSIGKMHRYSGKRFIGDVQAKYDRRVHVSRIPELFSPFGGVRFPSKAVAHRYQSPLTLNKLSFDRSGIAERSPYSGKRAVSAGLGVREPAAASVDFRDSYYAELHSRVDEWMEKVNNMSMQDVNRYSFRKGRSSAPGLPVQRAGSQPAPKSGAGPAAGGILPKAAPAEPAESKWRIGPMRTVKKVGGALVSDAPPPPPGNSVVSGASPSRATSGSVLPRPKPARPSPGFLPRLGPPKVSVSVGGGPAVEQR